MKALLVSMTMCLGLLAAGIGHAQTPATAPAGSTAQCKDGSWYSGETKKGACRGHKGIQEWYGASGSAAATSNAEATPKKTRSSKKEVASETAAPAATAPAGSTGLCRDGSYYSGAEKKGACRGHKGVKEWYGASGAATAGAAMGSESSMPSKSAMPMSPATPAATPPATSMPSHATHAMPANPKTISAAPGGGNGLVWANDESKVYHCQNDEWYGKTKKGEYLSEAAATAKGYHASHGKACAK